jgi:hypothetical protein
VLPFPGAPAVIISGQSDARPVWRTQWI